MSWLYLVVSRMCQDRVWVVLGCVSDVSRLCLGFVLDVSRPCLEVIISGHRDTKSAKYYNIGDTNTLRGV